MIKSMTGFGRGETNGWITEARSVNHRFGDIKYHLPRGLIALEGRFKEAIKKRIHRGRLDVSCSPDNSHKKQAVTLALDEEACDQVHALLNRLNERYGFRQEVDLPLLASFRDIFRTEEESPDFDRLWESIRPSLEGALESLEQMRQEEGTNLLEGLMASLQGIEDLHGRFSDRAVQVVETYRQRLLDRLQVLVPGEALDEGRLLQEVALFADRSDITEELERLMSHIKQFRKSMQGPGPHGRRLEFLLQEMNREINTIGSKGNDLLFSGWVVDCKCELEKIREQIQNVE